jgi:hypothetical protein
VHPVANDNDGVAGKARLRTVHAMNWSMADWQTRHEAGEQKLLSTANFE